MSNTLEDRGIRFVRGGSFSGPVQTNGRLVRQVTVRELYWDSARSKRGVNKSGFCERGEPIQIVVTGEAAGRLYDELVEQLKALQKVYPQRCLPTAINNVNYKSLPFIVREIEQHDPTILETEEGRTLKELAKIVTDKLNAPPPNPIADLFDDDDW